MSIYAIALNMKKKHSNADMINKPNLKLIVYEKVQIILKNSTQNFLFILFNEKSEC